MESLNNALALYGSNNECTRTNAVLRQYLRSAQGRFPFLYNSVLLTNTISCFTQILLPNMKNILLRTTGPGPGTADSSFSAAAAVAAATDAKATNSAAATAFAYHAYTSGSLVAQEGNM